MKDINQDEDDGDIGLMALSLNELKDICCTYGLPVSGTKAVLASCILQQMNGLQAAADAEEMIESGNGVIDNVDVSIE